MHHFGRGCGAVARRKGITKWTHWGGPVPRRKSRESERGTYHGGRVGAAGSWWREGALLPIKSRLNAQGDVRRRGRESSGGAKK